MGRKKEPDASWVIDGEITPTVIVEVGWSETYANLCRDLDYWMQGVAPPIRLGLLVNIKRMVGGVATFVEKFRPGLPVVPGPREVQFPPLLTLAAAKTELLSTYFLNQTHPNHNALRLRGATYLVPTSFQGETPAMSGS